MQTEYDADDFDMEAASGVDNPAEPGDTYDEGMDRVSGRKMSNQPKAYTVKTRFKMVDKKTGQLVYRVVKQGSNQTRKLLKPFSYKRK